MLSLEEQISMHADYCKSRIEELSQSVSRFKPGTLGSYQSGPYHRYKLLCPGRPPVNVSKNDHRTLEYYAAKKVFEARLADCRADLKLCGQFLPAFRKHPHAMENLFADKYLCALLSQRTPEADAAAWAEAEYAHLTAYPEERKIMTEAGIPVRSKGEATVVTGLMEIQAMFRYEEELHLGKVTLHPDFTVLHPKTHKIIIIEYFGMMDDEKYRAQAASKLKLYIDHGYTPDENLICFYETREKPLTIVYVRKKLQLELM